MCWFSTAYLLNEPGSKAKKLWLHLSHKFTKFVVNLRASVVQAKTNNKPATTIPHFHATMTTLIGTTLSKVCHRFDWSSARSWSSLITLFASLPATYIPAYTKSDFFKWLTSSGHHGKVRVKNIATGIFWFAKKTLEFLLDLLRLEVALNN